MLITPTGRKWWRQKYRFAGKERLRGLGTYPEVGLAEAREESLAIRKLLAKGLDPALQRKEVLVCMDRDDESRSNRYRAHICETG